MLMTPQFKGRHSQWKKMYKGQMYFVNCSELGLPETQWTEKGSYQAANDWWTKKKLELDTDPRVKEQKQIFEQKKSEVEQIIKDELELEFHPGNKQFEHILHDIYPDKYPASKIVHGLTLGYAIDKWYEVVAVNAKTSSLVSLNGYIRYFKDLLGDDLALSKITSDKVIEIHSEIAKKAWAAATKKKYWDTFRAFITDAAQNGWMNLPANLRSKRLVFEVKLKQKTLPDLDDMRVFLNSLDDRLKLYAMLALNCGMNNIDIGQIKIKQIDLKNKTLVRKRVKTADWNNVPTVRYGLRDETIRLLKIFMNKSDDGESPALLDNKGQPLYIEKKVEKKVSIYDKIKSLWRDGLGRSSQRKYSVKTFRDIGSMLLQYSQYRSYQVVWLGQSPKEVHQTNYSGEETVIEACKWLETKVFG